MALRINRMATSRNSTMVSRGQAASGCDQSMSGRRQRARAGSPRPHRRPRDQDRGRSSGWCARCRVAPRLPARPAIEIQPNRMAATIQPHSISLRRPTGVPGGMGPSCSTTRARAAMAAAVARRCHTSSIAGRSRLARSVRVFIDAHAGFVMPGVRRCGGRRRRRRRASAAAAVKRRWLLDRVPILLVRRDDHRR